MTSIKNTLCLFHGLTLFVLLTGCVSKDKPCEEILEVKRQVQQCEQWRQVMNNNNYPQQAITAKKRYDNECLALRFYRDEFDTICKGNQRPIGDRQSNDEHDNAL